MHFFHFSAVRPSVEWMDTGWAMSCMDVYCTEVISDDLSTPKHVTQGQTVDSGRTEEWWYDDTKVTNFDILFYRR